jgi:hypothetical protein
LNSSAILYLTRDCCFKLILPYLQLDIKYYDLGLEYRDQVCSHSINSFQFAHSYGERPTTK